MATEIDIVAAIENTEKNRQWIGSHRDELSAKYEGQVFAVMDEQVVGTSENLEDLLQEMKKRGEDSAFFVIESIPRKGVAYIL